MEKLVSNVNQMYSEMMMTMRMNGVVGTSERGPVVSLQSPALVTVLFPNERVLIDPVRLCNPFFHVAEACWMMAGHECVQWLEQFNKRIADSADDDGTINGAYGYRWRRHWPMDQIRSCVGILRRNQSSRRAVLQMWDPQVDLDVSSNDIPCNTAIFFRVIRGSLEATVTNRSNDVVWGMCGANAVHLTILQELMARELRLKIGRYHVMTNNAHCYLDIPGMEEMLGTTQAIYHQHSPLPLLQRNETLMDFLADCRTLINSPNRKMNTYWMRNVAYPMTEIYLKSGEHTVHEIACPQWRRAANEWLQVKRA
jgi:thymidylate synthase